MKGVNTLIVNQKTMQDIVQEWIERKMVSTKIQVTQVEIYEMGSFKISLTEIEKEVEKKV